MNYRNMAAALSLTVLIACKGDDSKTQAALSDTAQDTSLARDLALAGGDTLLYSEAADVAMRGEGDTLGAEEPRSSRPDVNPAPARPLPKATEPRPSASSPQTAPTEGVSACASAAAGDQRRCLMQYLARSDARLNRTYQHLISQTASPAEVERLRVAQRAWLVYRDTECRRKTRSSEGVLWAPIRAKCLGEYSAARERELAGRIQ